MAEERYYKHDGFERFTHWAHTLDTVILVLSGLQIHYPGFAVFGAMQNARFLHLVSAYLFVAIGVYHTYIFFALGKHRISMPGLFDFSEVGPILKYYFHLSREKPVVEKYNVLQKFGYFLLFAVSVLQSLLGLPSIPISGRRSSPSCTRFSETRCRSASGTRRSCGCSSPSRPFTSTSSSPRTSGWSGRWWTGTTTGKRPGM